MARTLSRVLLTVCIQLLVYTCASTLMPESAVALLSRKLLDTAPPEEAIPPLYAEDAEGFSLDEMSKGDAQKRMGSLPKQLHTNPHSSVPFHWAITACDRRQHWAQYLATTLLSAMTAGVQPLTITVVWCKPYREDQVPSMFKLARFSRWFNVLYVPENMPPAAGAGEVGSATRIAYMRALMVPEYLDAKAKAQGLPAYASQLPLLITEEDIVFAPDFHLKVAEVWRKVHEILPSKGSGKNHTHDNFMVTFYTKPDGVGITFDQFTKTYNTTKREDPAHVDLVGGPKCYWCCSQGIIYSPDMRYQMSRFFLDVYNGKRIIKAVWADTDHYHAGADFVVLDFLNLYDCWSNKRCAVFRSVPSLVEHTGHYASSIWNKATEARIHVSVDFPLIVKFPFEDAEGVW